MRVNLTLTHLEADEKGPAMTGVTGELTLTDTDLLRLGQVLFTASYLQQHRLSAKECAVQGKVAIEALQLLKLIGRQSEFNDEARAAHLKSLKNEPTRAKEAAKELGEWEGEGGK